MAVAPSSAAPVPTDRAAAHARTEHFRDDAAFVRRYRWLILAGLITAAIMEVLDTTIVNVAMPQMAGNLGATQEEIGWVSTGYILANVIILPMTAFFAMRFGRRRYLITSIVIFVVASFLCGTSNSLVQLVAWRILQGAGGAALMSTAQATLRQIVPVEEQGIVQAVFVLGIIVAPTLGPTLGGWLTDHYSWHWCFFINVPIGIVSTVLVSSFLRDPPQERAHTTTVDWAGIAMLTFGVGGLQYVLEEGSAKDWFESATIVRLAILAVSSLVALVWWELHPKNRAPVVNFRVLKNPTLASALFLFVALGFGLYGGVFLFPLFAQGILHFTPTETGLVMLPGGLATGASALICGALLNGKQPKADPRVLIALGVALFAVSMWIMGHLTTAAGVDDVRFALIVRGFGLGLLFIPINAAAYRTIRPAEAQQAAGLMNLSRQLGGAFGIAVLATQLNHMTQRYRVDLVSMAASGAPATEQRLQLLTRGFESRGLDPQTAHQGALSVINGQIQQQALMLSFNDAWILVLIAFLAVSPFILLLRKPATVPAGGMPADAH